MRSLILAFDELEMRDHFKMMSLSRASLMTCRDICCGLMSPFCSAFATSSITNSFKLFAPHLLHRNATRVRSPPPPLVPGLQPGSNQQRLVSSFWRAFLFGPTYRGILTLCRFLGRDRRRTHPTKNRHQIGSNGPKGSKSRDTPPSCPVTKTSRKQGRNELAENEVLRRNASSNVVKNPCPESL